MFGFPTLDGLVKAYGSQEGAYGSQEGARVPTTASRNYRMMLVGTLDDMNGHRPPPSSGSFM
jgi:hypothetical protein